MTTKPPSVEEFLRKRTRDRTWSGGKQCQTCAHPKAKQINHELRVFGKAKQEGHAMPWKRFIRERLTPVYGLRGADTSIMHHVRECLDVR